MGKTDLSKHVGNHGGVYTDIDGQTKQFTVVDHDKHTTRLKSWKPATPVTHISTPEELLALDIKLSGIAADADFITAYDTVLSKKFGFERLRTGRQVDELINENYKEEGWYTDLEQLFKESLKKRIAEMQGYIKKNYGLQK